MDCLASHIPPSLRSLFEAYAPPGLEEYVPYVGVALTSLLAVYVGYLYYRSLKEAAVTFNVPIPSEVRRSSAGKTWVEVQGQQKMVLQDQVRGVSTSWQCLSNALHGVQRLTYEVQKWNHQLIMSYCPADGRVLGNGTKPATVDDVNEAVRMAGAAQREWAKSTFPERRQVLRTLLKYVDLDGVPWLRYPGRFATIHVLWSLR